MNNGKEKCKALKQIRKQIADNNDIKYVVEECKHKGKCKGTCPKCESEVRYLERELEKRRALGKKVAIAGVSVGIAATFSACTPMDVVYAIADPIANIFDGGNDLGGATAPTYPEDLGGEAVPVYPEELDGDVEAPEPEPELSGEVEEYIPEDDKENNNTVTDDGCEDGNCDDGLIVIDGEVEPDDVYELEGGVEYYPEGYEVTIE